MSIFGKKYFCLLTACSMLSHPLNAWWSEQQVRSSMVEDLNRVKLAIEAGYAPLEWKKSHSGYDLKLEFENAKQHILELKNPTAKQFHQIAKKFLASLHDYHVNITFGSTESATLPFAIKGAEGRYFVDWVDKAVLPPAYYAIERGDEVLSIDGIAIQTIVDEVKDNLPGGSNELTNQRHAEEKLTERLGVLGDNVPQGASIIEFKSKATGQPYAYQLIWKYQAECIYNPHDYLMHISLLSPEPSKNEKTLMMSAIHQALHQTDRREGGLGSKKSFIPPLGKVLWKYEEEDSFWHAYMFASPNGKKVGYVRIPHYKGYEDDLKEFEKIIKYFESKTDALVIDQVNNYGGYVDFCYQLLSMLTNVPLATPKHQIKNTQHEILSAYYTLKQLNMIMDTLSFMDENELEEEQIDFQKLLFLKDYFSFNIREWNEGRSLTNPVHLEGVDFINPHPTCRYSKPILMLINELDFSGGDFVPAILKDNQRATLFGSRTGGAGGFVLKSSFPNENGILFFSYTGSIALRSGNQEKIEDLGISPDIEYVLKADDLENDYRGMVSAIKNAIDQLCGAPKN